MSDEAAFLGAIREYPDEDTPRLAFADWLDEQGDSTKSERAAFIRAQVELARLPSDDPRCVDLEVIERQLLAKNVGAWAAPCPAFQNWEYAGEGPYRAVFRRGFLEAVDGLGVPGGTSTNYFAELCAAHPIRDGGVFPTNNLASTASWPEWGRIESLKLWASFTARHPASYPGEQFQQVDSFLQHADLTRLRKLGLTLPEIGERSVLHWFRMPLFRQLTGLDLAVWARDVPQNGDLVLELANGDFPNLRKLYLSSIPTAAYTRATNRFINSDTWKRITSLHLGNGSDFPWIRALATARLQRLALTASVGSGTAQAFANAVLAVPDPVTLEELRLHGPGTHGEDLSRILASHFVSNLRWLRFDHAELTDDDLRRIAESPALANLNSLSLWLHHTAGAGLHALFASPNLGRLTDLQIHGGRVPPDAIRALARNSSCRGLRTLTLGSLFVPSALTALADGDVFPDLHTIAFECWRPSPDPSTVEAFVNSPKFPRLCVVHFGTDSDYVQDLLPVFRNCKRLAWAGGEMIDGGDGTRVALVPENVYLPNHLDGLSE
ncbi:TIGR02996 domain-containing protein [Gemmata sp. G18]|uniref:TIGR02996 domain-containing protein n=1 Tax=Gemmata palustris TaxID=2822762 RepID=A0ABS5BQU0_9BACT|nr:TIGR02996 domain-containing protein [Gemmata palustris]MBP3956088.1 TIGR02996 domain-containing protein [Gemmata palustris]